MNVLLNLNAITEAFILTCKNIMIVKLTIFINKYSIGFVAKINHDSMTPDFIFKLLFFHLIDHGNVSYTGNKLT